MCELKKEKLIKMINDVISRKLDLPKIAFKTLCKTYENICMIEETFITEPVEIIEIKRLRPPPKPKQVIKKDPNFAECINEMQINQLFLKCQKACMVS